MKRTVGDGGGEGCVGPSTTSTKLAAAADVVVVVAANWLPVQTATSWLTMIVGHNLVSQSATLLCMTFLWLGALVEQQKVVTTTKRKKKKKL